MVGTVGTSSKINPNDPVLKSMEKFRQQHAKNQQKDYSHVFRRKSYFELIRMACIITGIEMAYAAETAFVSPTLLQIGIDHKHMTMVWGLSPMIGFFLAPLMGSLSDRCRLKIGRRRPIIALLGLGILLGLIFIPYGRNLGVLFGDIEQEFLHTIGTNFTDLLNTTSVEPVENVNSAVNYKYAVILTILGTILLDFDADTCLGPSRAYILDVCVQADHAKALSIYSAMAGLGGFLGYLLGAIDWELTPIGDFFGGNIKACFGIVTIAFVISFILTVTSFREVPLELLEKDELLRPISSIAIKKEQAKADPIYLINDSTAQVENGLSGAPDTSLNSGKEISLSVMSDDAEEMDDKVTLAQYLKSIIVMPKSMRILCLTNLFCWMGHLCFCLYFTDFVGEAVFHGNPAAPVNSREYELYDEGVRFGCWGLAIYAFSCLVYSSLVDRLIKLLSLKAVYIGGILVYALGMLVLAVWPTKIGVLLLSTTGGILYATVFTMPFILVAQYHANGCFKVKSGINVPMQQSRGLGTDIAIVSGMIFVGQLIVSMTVGSLVSLMNSTTAVLYAASGVSVCGALAATKVLYLK